jgi:hypothetical protein
MSHQKINFNFFLFKNEKMGDGDWNVSLLKLKSVD